MHRIFFRVFAILTLFLSFAFGAIGKITTVSGNVTIERGAKKEKAVANLQLEEKDTIVSGAGATAQIIFNDKTVITVGQNSSFKIEEYLHGGSEPRARFRVNEGAFKTVTGQIAKVAPEKFKVETKTATIGIRGTIFQGTVNRSGAVTVACTRGAIVVMPTVVVPGTPPPPPVVVKEGQFTQASAAGVEPPKTLTPAVLKQLDKEVTADKKAQQQEAQSSSGGQGGQGGTTQTNNNDGQGGTQSNQGGGDTTTTSTATTSNDAQTGGDTTTQAPSSAPDGGATQPQQSAAADTLAQGATPTPPPLGAEGLPTAQNITPLAMPTTPTMPSDVVNAVNQTVVASVNSAVTSAVNAGVVEQVTQVVTNPTTPTNPTPPEPTTPTNPLPTDPTTPTTPTNPLPTDPTTPTTPTVPTTPTEPIPTEPTVPTCEYGGTYPNCNPPPQQYCTNGATNYPTCTTCAANYKMEGGVCVYSPPKAPIAYNALPTAGAYGNYSVNTINVSNPDLLSTDRQNMYFNFANKSYLHRYFDFDETSGFVFDVRIGNISDQNGTAYFSGSGYAFSATSEGNVSVQNGYFDISHANPYFEVNQTYNRGTGVENLTSEITGATQILNETSTPFYYPGDSGARGPASNNATTYTLYGYVVGHSVAKPSFLNLATYDSTNDTSIAELVTMYNSLNPMFSIDKTTGQITSTFGHLSPDSQTTVSSYISEDNFGGMFQAGTIGGIDIDTQRSVFFTIPDADGIYNSYTDHLSWGYWKAESNQTADSDRVVNFGYWVAGAHSDPSIVAAKSNARYFGKVLGSLVLWGKEYAAIIVDDDNKVDLVFDFGGSSMSGSIAFKTTKNPANIWRLDITNPYVSTTSFSADFNTQTSSIGDIDGDGSAETLDGGNLTGSYYGPNVDSVGGRFSALTADGNVTGVFKAIESVPTNTTTPVQSSVIGNGKYAFTQFTDPNGPPMHLNNYKLLMSEAFQSGNMIESRYYSGAIDTNGILAVTGSEVMYDDIYSVAMAGLLTQDSMQTTNFYLETNGTTTGALVNTTPMPFNTTFGPNYPWNFNTASTYSTNYSPTGGYTMEGDSVGYTVDASKLTDLSVSTSSISSVGSFSGVADFGTGDLSSVAITTTGGATLTGSGITISEDTMGASLAGTIQAETVNAARSYLVAMPDDYNATTHEWFGVPNYSSWGYWKAESNVSTAAQFGFWVGGAKTAAGELPTSNVTHHYDGHVMGAVTSSGGAIDLIRQDGNNIVALDIAFGSSAPVSGSINFRTVSENYWDIIINGDGSTVSSNTFGATPVAGSGGGNTIISGDINGSFYGPLGTSVGGSFRAENNISEVASGVFKAGMTSVTSQASSPLIDRASLPSIGLYTARNTLGTPYSLIADFDKNKTSVISAIQEGAQIKAAFVNGTIYSDANSKAFVSTDGTPLGDIAQGFGTDAYFKGDNTALSPYYLDVNSTSYAQQYHPFVELISGNKAPDYSVDYNTTGSYNPSGRTVGWQVNKASLTNLGGATDGNFTAEGTMAATGSFASQSTSSMAINYMSNNISRDNTSGSTMYGEDSIGTGLTGTIADQANNSLTYDVENSKSFLVSMPDFYDDVNGSWKTSDDYSSWGYWKAEANASADFAHFGFWVGGVKTLESEINTLVSNEITATYSGFVMGAVTPSGGGVGAIDLIKLDGTNRVNLAIAFGAGAQAVTGNMNFQTVSGSVWDVTIDGSAANNTATITPSTASFGVTGGFSGSANGGSNLISSGNINGNFYGKDAASVGGTFMLQTDTQMANGVFKAKKP